MESYDVLIFGSGVAGLSTAIRLIECNSNMKLAILTKASLSDTATKLAQGGIAIVRKGSEDTCESHIKDTMEAGGWTNDIEVVKFVIKSADEVYNDLIRWNFQFEKEPDGKDQLHREGGHSIARILHSKDLSGLELENKLIEIVSHSEQITLLENYFIVDLIVGEEPGSCSQVVKGVQAYAINERKMIQIPAKFCVISTGGSGQVYEQTSNPVIATGDGVAIGLRAGCVVEKMNFIQFHPTVLFSSGHAVSLPILTEALRGSGAFIVNFKNERFIFKYHSDGELACRDVVSFAIEKELLINKKDCVYMDIRHLDQIFLKENYPQVVKILNDYKIDYMHDLIPIKPAAHYQCGGIKVNIHGETNVRGLFACGECASTGMHGNNRLASNSLLEAIVFAKQVSAHILNIEHRRTDPIEYKSVHLDLSSESNTLVRNLAAQLKACMSQNLAVIKSQNRMKQALKQILTIEVKLKLLQIEAFSVEYFELRNLIEIAKLICTHSLEAYHSGNVEVSHQVGTLSKELTS